jgi:hypothetical protein
MRVFRAVLFLAVLCAAATASESPGHIIEQGNFRKASAFASSRPRRSVSADDAAFGAMAPDSADASDIEPAWTSLSAAGSSESMGAKVTSDGGIQLVPLSGGVEGASVAEEYLAEGTFHDQLDQVGWSSVMMRTSKAQDVDDGVKMYAAGALEGFMTAKRIREFHDNSRALLEMNPDNHGRLSSLQHALKQTVSGLVGMAEDEDGTAGSGLNAQARLALLQTWGVRDGYALAAEDGKPSLSMSDMFLLNSDGVVDELVTALGGGVPSLLQRSSSRQHLRGPASNSTGKRARTSSGHCTGVVRLADGNSEVYFGHTTWESFSEMTRIWKVYDFPLQGAAANKISFSSYPGCISSTDDYYLMDSGLAITETTLSIPKKQDYPTSQTVPDFMRIMAANRMSANAEDWVRNMQDSATGTYSSQWMVMDYKKFTPGQELPDGAFYVFEQAPGASHYEDMSGHLREKRYWASFDRAYFDDVRASTGDNAMQEKEGSKPEAELFSKDHTPRAQIAAATEGDITSLVTMREEMTRNKGTNEPVDAKKLQIPSFAISARSDLADNDGRINNDGSPDGGVDAKITSSCLFRTLTAQAISSPSHTTLPAFKWTKDDGSEVWPGYPHEGLPNEANFDWVRVDPQEQMLNPLSDGSCQ